MTSGLLGAWPPLPPGALARRASPPPPFPLSHPGTLITSQGRGGLYLGLRALGVGAGDEVLMPGYHHGSEVEATRRTGATPVFYSGTSRLEPSASELEELTGPATRALHLTHFLGFPQDVSRWRSWCDERSLLLVEDAAQAWLSTADGKPVGSLGDLGVFCLYKTVGVPDGAATVCRADLPGHRSSTESGIGAGAKRIGLWAAQQAPGAGRLGARRSAAPAAFDPAKAFDLGEADGPASRITTYLVGRFDHARAVEDRRRNYQLLLDALSELVPPPFDSLPEGAVPWLFPVRAQDKRGLLSHLRRGGVSPLDFWSVPHPSFEAQLHPDVASRRATTIGLPVHQELSTAQCRRIASLVCDGPR